MSDDDDDDDDDADDDVDVSVADDDPSKPLQSSQLTHLQERLLKKLGPNAYPFYFEVS